MTTNTFYLINSYNTYMFEVDTTTTDVQVTMYSEQEQDGYTEVLLREEARDLWSQLSPTHKRSATFTHLWQH